MSVQEKLFGTAAVMATRNPLVPKGAVAAESDTGVVKIGDGATRYNSLSTALGGTYAHRTAGMSFDPGSLGTAAVPATADTGQALTTFTNTAVNPAPLSIVSGKIAHTPHTGASSAGYMQTDLGSRVRRVGAMVSWPAASAGVVALVCPSTAWSDGVLPVAGIHLALAGDGTWTLARWNGTTTVALASSTTGGQFADVRDGVQRPLEVWIDPTAGTARVIWPDGTSTLVTDSHIASDTGNFAVWELFENNGATDTAASIGKIWADTLVPVGASNPTPQKQDVFSEVAGLRSVVAEHTSNASGVPILPGCLGIFLTLFATGGAGGSGRRGAAGTVRCGGGSGGSGGILQQLWIPRSALGPTYAVVIPAGPAGGAAVSADDTNGNNGTGGLAATFTSGSTFVRALAGGAGSGGTSSTGSAGGAGAPLAVSGVAASTTGGAGTAGGASNTGACGVAGTGGGITSGDVPGAGGAGTASNIFSSTGTGGTGGVVGGASPTSGAAALGGRPGDGPGGGAASITGAAQAGATASGYGAGGAGGGASLNGNASGKGGDAGPAYGLIQQVLL